MWENQGAVNSQNIIHAYEQIAWHREGHKFYIVAVEYNGLTLYHNNKPTMTRWSRRLGYALSAGPTFGFWMNSNSAQQCAEDNVQLYNVFPLTQMLQMVLEQIHVIELDPDEALRALQQEMGIAKGDRHLMAC